jgi:hypothetical protein
MTLTNDPKGFPTGYNATLHTHYIAMSGTRGCLPDSCNAYEFYESAVNELAAMFELGRTRKARLFADRYLDLSQADGAEYCEITECCCLKPWEHCDAGSDPRDWEEYPQGEHDPSDHDCKYLGNNAWSCGHIDGL